MDPLTVVAVVMLAAWGGITMATEAPGFVHLLLTGGVFLLLWRIVVRGTRAKSAAARGPSSQKR